MEPAIYFDFVLISAYLAHIWSFVFGGGPRPARNKETHAYLLLEGGLSDQVIIVTATPDYTSTF